MTIRYKDEGRPGGVAWRLAGAKLTLGGQLELDLEALAGDDPVSLCVSETRDGRLTLGPAWRYVAELSLPARQSRIEKLGYTDDFGYPALGRRRLPLALEDAVLTLWPGRGTHERI